MEIRKKNIVSIYISKAYHVYKTHKHTQNLYLTILKCFFDFTGVGNHSSEDHLSIRDETSQTNGSAMCPDISIANTPPDSIPDTSSPSTQVMEITVKQEEDEHSERPLKRLRTDTDPNSEGSVPHNETEII